MRDDTENVVDRLFLGCRLKEYIKISTEKQIMRAWNERQH
jgi:hypothetical protein